MQLYLSGRGNVDVAEYKAHMAAEAYEQRCSFKRNPDTGQWCIYIAIGREYDPPEMPVRGWDYIPTPDEITQYMSEHDMAKHGHRLRTEMNARNQKRSADREHMLDQLAEETAERMEATVRRAGEHPNHRSYRKISRNS